MVVPVAETAPVAVLVLPVEGLRKGRKKIKYANPINYKLCVRARRHGDISCARRGMAALSSFPPQSGYLSFIGNGRRPANLWQVGDLSSNNILKSDVNYPVQPCASGVSRDFHVSLLS